MKIATHNTNFLPLQRETHPETPAWQRVMADAITEVDELFALLELPASWLEGAQRASQLFPLKLPRRMVKLMEKGNPHDPLLRQVLPLGVEGETVSGFSHDPVGDLPVMRSPGLLQKYHGRVLLTLTGACALHCRYCFRRHFAYNEANPTRHHWEATLAAIRNDATINEVIFSGGDPLSLSDERLSQLVDDLATIPHLNKLRIHTRLPVFIPERITPGFITILQQMPFKSVLVLHINHAHEIDSVLGHALQQLRSANVTLLNQSVLLKGVNDDAITLAALSETLFAHGVLPYYLHLLDRVAGAHHFEVAESRAEQLYQQLLATLPGYLVPRFVREEAGAPNKTALKVSIE